MEIAKMDSLIECIALFLKGYIEAEDFASFAYANIEAFEALLDDESYHVILDYSLLDKNSKLALLSTLERFLESNNPDDLASVHDAYVERIIDSDRDDYWADYLRRRNAREKEIIIDCESVLKKEDLLREVKSRLGLDDTCCGDSWDSIDDLIFEAKYPERLIFKNWSIAEKNAYEDSQMLVRILKKYEDKVAIVFE